MGLLSGLFGSSRDDDKEELEGIKSLAEGLYTDISTVVEDERARFEEMKKKQEEEAIAYQQRSQNLQGGGRKGLMYGGNAKGVTQ